MQGCLSHPSQAYFNFRFPSPLLSSSCMGQSAKIFPVWLFFISLLSSNFPISFCLTDYTTPAKVVAVNYTDEDRHTDHKELEAVYEVMSATGNGWARDIPDVCLERWHGIECSEDDDNVLHVTSLSFGVVSEDTAFPDCAPNSSISPSIQNLPFLKQLFFYRCCNDNPLPIPKEIGKLGSSLEWLVLRENGHVGAIPQELNSLAKLNTLDLHGNSLTGNITLRLHHAVRLQSLDLSSNKLEGAIPDEPQALPQSLVILDLSNNRLHGSIPQQALSNLSALRKLDLSGNNLSGRIPSNLRSLVLLDLSGNPIQSGIPEEICRLSSLQALLLKGNKMQTPIPDCIGDLGSLQVLLLSHSQFTGQTPTSIGKLKRLKALHLDGNLLTGSIPVEIGELRSLSELDMRNNFLSGPVLFSRSFLQQLGRKLLLEGNQDLCRPATATDARQSGFKGLRSCDTILDSAHISTPKLLHVSSSIPSAACSTAAITHLILGTTCMTFLLLTHFGVPVFYVSPQSV